MRRRGRRGRFAASCTVHFLLVLVFTFPSQMSINNPSLSLHSVWTSHSLCPDPSETTTQLKVARSCLLLRQYIACIGCILTKVSSGNLFICAEKWVNRIGERMEAQGYHVFTCLVLWSLQVEEVEILRCTRVLLIDRSGLEVQLHHRRWPRGTVHIYWRLMRTQVGVY